MSWLVLGFGLLALGGTALIQILQRTLDRVRDQSRTAAMTELLKRHASEDRRVVIFPDADGRQKYTEWEQRFHVMQAKRRTRA